MDIPTDTTCGPTTLALMFGVTAMRVQQLASDGVVVRKGRGQYLLIDSVRNYLAYSKGKPKNQHDGSDSEAGRTYEAHRARLTKAKADIAEIEADLKKGTTHDAAAVAAVWADMIGNARAKLLGLPTKLAGALDGLTITEREAIIKDGVNEALQELAEYSPDVVTGEWERRRQPMQDEDDEEPEADEDEPEADE